MISGTTEEAVNGVKRHYIRHPTGLPVACRSLGNASEPSPSGLYNVGVGGLAFLTDRVYRKGDELELTFPSLRQTEPLRGVVVWTQDVGGRVAGRYACGIQFSNQDMHFRARLVEQICHIEAYRLTQMKQSRILTPHEAAAEWVAKFAHRFPR